LGERRRTQPDREPTVVQFDPSTAGKREVDPAELVGKVINNIYVIGPKYVDDEDKLPGSYGICFTDGSKYHIRMPSSWSDGRVEFEGGGEDIDDDNLGGKRVAAASLLEYTKFSFDRTLWELGLSSSGDESYTAIGIKIDGDDRWHRFEGVETDYDSDGMSKLAHSRVFLVKMKGPGHQGGGRGRRRR
jgi:hypothetical protein